MLKLGNNVRNHPSNAAVVHLCEEDKQNSLENFFIVCHGLEVIGELFLHQHEPQPGSPSTCGRPAW